MHIVHICANTKQFEVGVWYVVVLVSFCHCGKTRSVVCGMCWSELVWHQRQAPASRPGLAEVTPHPHYHTINTLLSLPSPPPSSPSPPPSSPSSPSSPPPSAVMFRFEVTDHSFLSEWKVRLYVATTEKAFHNLFS